MGFYVLLRNDPMTDDDLNLLRTFFEEFERAILSTAGLMDRARAGTLPSAEADNAADKLRTLAGQTRWIRDCVLPPTEPQVN